MLRPPLDLTLPSPDATAAAARALAPRLAAGDVLLLRGGIGAGKTHFARSLIQARLGRAEEVPSPTFTLVQTYATQEVELWHADLYRLTGPEEVEDLGLFDAFDTAICLIEWPDRLGAAVPSAALTLTFRLAEAEGEDARTLRLDWRDARWPARLEALA